LLKIFKPNALRYLSGRMVGLREVLGPLVNEIADRFTLDALNTQDIVLLLNMRIFEGRSYGYLAKRFGFSEITIYRFFEGRKNGDSYSKPGAVQIFREYLERRVCEDFMEQFYSNYELAENKDIFLTRTKIYLESLQDKYGLTLWEAMSRINFLINHRANNKSIYMVDSRLNWSSSPAESIRSSRTLRNSERLVLFESPHWQEVHGKQIYKKRIIISKGVWELKGINLVQAMLDFFDGSEFDKSKIIDYFEVWNDLLLNAYQASRRPVKFNTSFFTSPNSFPQRRGILRTVFRQDFLKDDDWNRLKLNREIVAMG